MKCPDISIPEPMQRLPRDARGYPIPYYLDLGDRTNFKAMNAGAVLRCIQERRCSLCGEPLGYWLVFMGGSRSCAAHMFGDPPSHPDCADYAMQVCPYILHAGWSRQHPHLTPKLYAIESLVRTETYRYLTRSYELQQSADGALIFHAGRPKAITLASPKEDP